MIVTLYGGPKANRRYRLRNENVSFLRCGVGHYARVRGGKRDAFYWYDFAAPLAIRRGNMLVPVQDFKPAENGEGENDAEA